MWKTFYWAMGWEYEDDEAEKGDSDMNISRERERGSGSEPITASALSAGRASLRSVTAPPRSHQPPTPAQLVRAQINLKSPVQPADA